eukprot:scaffold36269_cov40-Cyclotella_meneghiniana.AAC.4
MNSNNNNNNMNDPSDESDNNSDCASSTSSSRAERLRRERTQRHRQRLQRVKQFQQSGAGAVGGAGSAVGAGQQQTSVIAGGAVNSTMTSNTQHQQQQQSNNNSNNDHHAEHQHTRSNSEGSSMSSSSQASASSSVASSGITAARRRLLQTNANANSNASSGKDNTILIPKMMSSPKASSSPSPKRSQQQRTVSVAANNIQNNAGADSASTTNTNQSIAQQQQQQQQQRNTNVRETTASNNHHHPNKLSNNTATSSSNNKAMHSSSRSSKSSYIAASSIPPPPSPPKHPNYNTHHVPSSNIIQPTTTTSNKPSSSSGPVLVSVESPLPPLVQRSLGDRSYEKRKNAALEIEQLVKSLSEANNLPMISSIISVLAKDFCTSMNANYRKGGLIGIAAASIGLLGNTRQHLEGLLFPVLHCFDDPEARVRYYACESLYNIAKVARGSVLRYFNPIFDGLTKLFADVDVDVKNGANLLDRLIKDIVTESESFHVEHFLPLLQTYIRRTNPYIRQLLVGWITVLDSVPDISMIDYLPDFLDGLFNMLSDSNREIRQAADSALSDFLKEVRHSSVLELGPLIAILVHQCLSKDRLNRLTAVTWIEELIRHPVSGGDALLPHHADVLGAILYCISDSEEQICVVAERTNADLLSLVRDTKGDFRIAPLLDTLTEKIMNKDDVPTKMASLRWINMLLEKRRGDMTETLLENRGSLVVRKFCVLLDAESVYMLMAEVLSSSCENNHSNASIINKDDSVITDDVEKGPSTIDPLSKYDESAVYSVEFVSTMVQTLNLILLTASELHGLRVLLAKAFETKDSDLDELTLSSPHDELSGTRTGVQ